MPHRRRPATLHRRLRSLALLALGMLALQVSGNLEAQTFVRGDANADTSINIADPIFTLNWLTSPGAPAPPVLDAADTNDNGVVEIADTAYMFRFLFSGTGLAPPAPFPVAGIDTTPPNFPAAPTGELAFELTTTQACPGAQALVSLNITNTVAIEAVNVRVAFDQNFVSFSSASDDPLINVLGETADFFQVNGSVPGELLIACLFDFIDPTGSGLQPGTNVRVFDMILDVSAATPSMTTTPLLLEDNPGAFPPQFNLGSNLGEVILADTTDGSVTTNCNPVEFLRGDANDDLAVSVSDAVYLIEFLFLGGVAMNCDRSGDANVDGGLNVADIVFLLNALFSNGPTIPAPWPTCGPDPLVSPLSCGSSACP